MQKNLLLLAAIMLALGFYFLFQWNQGNSSVDPEDIQFAIEDTSAVQTILLTDYKRGDVVRSVGLYRQADGSWSLNNEYPAFQPRVNQLLRVMHLIHVKELLAENGQETALQLIDLTHTKVEAYDAQNQPINSYYLSVEGKGSRGSLMMLEGAEMPVIVELPGLQGFVNPFYNTELAFWRENLLFNAHLGRIRSVEFQFPKTAATPIRLQTKVNGLDWELLGQEVDSFRLAQYLKNYQGPVYAESFAGGSYPDMYKELSQQTADIRVVVRYRDETERAFVLYERTDNLNNYFGWIEGTEELLTVQRFVFDKFLLSGESL